jgi:CHAT domain-containing protein/tetratricopeptide (TPR) repeat protein
MSRRILIRTSLLIVLALLAMYCPSAALNSSAKITGNYDPSSHSFQINASADPLVPGAVYDFVISSGQTATHQVKLAASQFVRIDLCSMEVDLQATTIGPNQKEIAHWYIGRGASQPIAWIASIPGIYGLRISVLKGNYFKQSYRIGITAQRTANLSDRKRAVACQKLSEAIHLNREWIFDSLVRAVRKYEDVLELWRSLDDKQQQVLALCRIGDVYRLLSENEKAMTAYSEASRSEGAFKARARILCAIGELYRRKGDNENTAKCFRQALYFSLLTGDLRGERESLYKLGTALWTTDRYAEAQKYYFKALSIAAALNDKIALADTHLYLGYTYHAQKEIKEAQNHYEQCLKLGQETEEMDEQASALLALGHLKVTVGDLQNAFGFYDQAMAHFKTIGDRSNQNSALQGMADAYHAMGNSQRALELYRRSLLMFRELNNSYLECRTLWLIAELHQELGNYDEAIRYCKRSLQVNGGESLDLRASVLATMGKVSEKQGRIDESLDYYENALLISQQVQDRFLEALLLNAIGHAYQAKRENHQALNYFHKALELQQEWGDVSNRPGTYYNRALAQRDLGNLDEALKDIDEAIRSTETLRVKVADPEFRASYNASANDIHKYAIELLMELNRQRPDAGNDAEALKANERALARSLLESLAEARADIRQGVDDSLLEREHDLQHRLNARGQEQLNLLSTKHTHEQVAALSKEIDDLAGKYHEVQELIRLKSPRYAALTQPQPIAVQQIQKEVLDSDTMLLEFSLGEERSYLWAVTPTSLNSFELPSRSEIEKAARDVREMMLAPPLQVGVSPGELQIKIKNSETQYPDASAALSRMLFGKAAHLFGKKRFMIVAEGALQYLPFAALPEPSALTAQSSADNQQTRLIDNHEIVYASSASVLAAVRKENRDRPVPPKMIAVFADPVFEKDDPRLFKKRATEPTAAKAKPVVNKPVTSPHGWPITSIPASKAASKPGAKLNAVEKVREGISLTRLPFTRNEAQAAVASVPADQGLKILDFDASVSAINNAHLSQYRVLHFATHGVLDSEHPDLSALVLSLFDEKGRAQNGFLRLSDIYNLDLSAQLVVLSACNTGLGKEIRGEGLVGIVRGFMYAGAPRVIASLWKVEDEATAELMKRFYQHLFEKGEPAAAALRAAQIEISQQKRWKSPYFWAPFVLQGEWK